VLRELGEEDYLALGASRQMLHAARLGFPHPSTGAWTEVEAPLPEDFLRLVPSLTRLLYPLKT